MPYKHSEDQRAAEKRYRKRNRAKVNLMLRVYAQAHPDQRRETQRQYRKRNPDVPRTHRLRQYGITPQIFETMLESQQYLCLICKVDLRVLEERNRHVDHDHQTGKVRGILCRYCNNGLGNFKDNIENLLRAVEYLKR